MKKRINKIVVSLFATSALLLSSCSDWTDPESVDLNVPTLENQDPELYAQYLSALRAYKEADHYIAYASMNNTNDVISHRNQHITSMPDSLDVISIVNAEGLSTQLQEEMNSVREDKGTLFVYPIQYATFVSEWKTILEEEEAAAVEAATDDDTATDDEEAEDDSAERFRVYCAERVEEQLTYCAMYGFDGIEVSYSGVSLSSQDSETLAETALDQAAFMDLIEEWKEQNSSKLLYFRGTPQNLVDKTILSSCENIIIDATSAVTSAELGTIITYANSSDVPSDRFLIAVSTNELYDDTSFTGYFSTLDSDGNYLSAIVGAATWVLESNSNYTKCGIAIDNVERDYFHSECVFKNVKAGIAVMNP